MERGCSQYRRASDQKLRARPGLQCLDSTLKIEKKRLATDGVESELVQGCLGVLDAKLDAPKPFGQLVNKLLLDWAVCRVGSGHLGVLSCK